MLLRDVPPPPGVAEASFRGPRQAARAAGKGSPRGPSFWPLLAGCWLSYGATLLLGALPYRSEPGVFFNHAMYPVCTFLFSLPLWACCRRMWERGWSWPRAMLAAAALCYPLGYLSALLANEIANLRAAPPAPLSWVLLSGLGASSPFCALVVWCGLYFGLRQYERSARVDALAREAELRTLRHQLTPHFLCNTLNGISTLVGEGRAQEARRMIARLGDFLRTTLDGVGVLETSLAQEIAYLEQYLAIEQARLGDRLGVDIRAAPESLDASVPNLLLQPLVENAVQHGVVPFPEGGDVTVRAERQGDHLRLTVRNRRREPSANPDSGAWPPAAGNPTGLGLQNTAERLRVTYGTAAGVSCRRDGARGWTTTIELPYRPWTEGARPPSEPSA